MIESMLYPGPRPPGDPAGMRMLAAELRAQAHRAGRLGRDVHTPRWQGVSARAFAGRHRVAVSSAEGAADLLLDTARLLERSADDTEMAQRAWQRRMEEYRAEQRRPSDRDRP